MASAEPLIASVDLWAATQRFIPSGWTVCYGQLMSISQYEALYAVMGKTFGGDGITTFGLPDMRGRVPVGVGKSPKFAGNYIPGQMGGTETITLTIQQMPLHSHGATFTPNGSGGGKTINAPINIPVQDGTGLYVASNNPVNNFLGPSSSEQLYADSPNNTLASFNIQIDIANANGGTVTISPTGGDSNKSTQPFSIMQPYTVLFYIIALEGLFPTPADDLQLK